MLCVWTDTVWSVRRLFLLLLCVCLFSPPPPSLFRLCSGRVLKLLAFPHLLLVLSGLLFGFIGLCDLLGLITMSLCSVSPQSGKYTAWKVPISLCRVSVPQRCFLLFLSSPASPQSKEVYFRQKLQQHNTKLVYLGIDYCYMKNLPLTCAGM